MNLMGTYVSWNNLLGIGNFGYLLSLTIMILGGIMGGTLLMIAFPILIGLLICMCGEIMGALGMFTLALSINTITTMVTTNISIQRQSHLGTNIWNS